MDGKEIFAEIIFTFLRDFIPQIKNKIYLLLLDNTATCGMYISGDFCAFNGYFCISIIAWSLNKLCQLRIVCYDYFSTIYFVWDVHSILYTVIVFSMYVHFYVRVSFCFQLSE